MNEHCGCPGPNAISPTGCCDRCGYVGTQREEAIRSAIASGRHQLAEETGQYQGRRDGITLGIEIGRRQVIEALLRDQVGDSDTHPALKFDRELEAEL